MTVLTFFKFQVFRAGKVQRSGKLTTFHSVKCYRTMKKMNCSFVITDLLARLKVECLKKIIGVMGVIMILHPTRSVSVVYVKLPLN